ncbi:MAG: polyprenyl synthetase family protein [Bacteroidales bacterium]|nr:polyprenyl synthetase family protein [Bacteroidales bacterium]MBQ9186115.1 polyprenyl synthetase family protein [Bacteroidales bacterium]
MKELKAFIKNDMDKVAALIEESLLSDIDLLSRCNRHVLDHCGKQVRPMLTILMACATCGKANADTLRYAAAAELIHNATLMHDDVADSSISRRGVATVSSLLGPRPSVLLGDFWLVKGIARILEGERESARVMNIFGKTLSDLAEGEMLQLEMARSGATTEKEYYRIIYDKTASLFVASALGGVISAGASQEQEKAAEEFASCIGIAFQIKDDILDYMGDEALGKPAGQDLREKKITLPLLGAMKSEPASEPAVREWLRDIGPDKIEKIRSFVFEKDGIRYAKEAMNDYLCKAVAALEAFPDGRSKSFLKMLAAYIGERNY